MKNHKIILCLLCSISFFLFHNFACAEEMSVAGNIFNSVYPKLTIKVDPDLVYIGKFRKDPTVKSVSSSHEGQQIYKWFIFAKTNNDTIERILWIYFTEVPMRWKMLQNDFGTEKNCINKSKVRLGKYNFDSCTLYRIVSEKGEIASFLNTKGIRSPKCAIEKRFGMYPSDTKAFAVGYAEDIAPHGFSCSDFADIRLLSDKAKAYLKDFEERCMNSFSAQ
jgi:hypothetical protein